MKMLRKIIKWPNKTLREKSTQVIEEDVSELVKDLIDTCNVKMGAGLAAPQIGVNKQVVVIKPRVFNAENPDPSSYNPEFMVLIIILKKDGFSCFNIILQSLAGLHFDKSCLNLPDIP